MSARYAALGMLREGPAYSYELAARITELLGPGYNINSGQMTQILKTLHKDELIEPVGEPKSRGKSRREGPRVYAITDEGREDFEDFLGAEPDVAQLFRRSLLVKIALAGPERLEEILPQLDAYEQGCTNRINDLGRALERILPDDQPLPRIDRAVLRLGLEADNFQLRAELAWARHAREIVSWLVHSGATWPATRKSAEAPDRASQARRDEARRSLLGRLAARERDL
jgi:DNA-binding PadR family transcriptional regulator